MDQTEKSGNDQPHGQVKTRLKRFGIASAWILSCVAVLGLIIWGLWIISGCLNPAISDPIQFVTANLLNALIFAAIVAQVLIYRKQWRVMKKQWRVMKGAFAETRRVFHLTERPLVIAISVIVDNLAPNQPLRPKVTFANKGRTAAQKFRITTEIAAQVGSLWMFEAFDFGKTGEASPSIPQEVSQGDWFLGAGDQITVISRPSAAVTLDEQSYNDFIITGRESFIVHGKGSYEDLGGTKWPIQYAFVFDPDVGFTHYPVIPKHSNPEGNKENNPN